MADLTKAKQLKDKISQEAFGWGMSHVTIDVQALYDNLVSQIENLEKTLGHSTGGENWTVIDVGKLKYD